MTNLKQTDLTIYYKNKNIGNIPICYNNEYKYDELYETLYDAIYNIFVLILNTHPFLHFCDNTIAIDDLSSCRTHKVTVFSYNSQNKNWDLINTKTFINHLRSNLSREYICF